MGRVVRFIAAHSRACLFSFLGISSWPLFLIETEFNAPFAFAFRYLTIPIAIGCWLIGTRYQDDFMRGFRSRGAYRVTLALFIALIVLLCGGIVSGANALLPPQSEFVLEGTIVGRFLSGKRSESSYLEVETSDGIKKIEVARRDYDIAQPGMRFRQMRRSGPFGFSYRWRI